MISDEKIAHALTKICDAHFGDVAGYSITPNSEPVRVVSVQLSLRIMFFFYYLSVRYPSDLASGTVALGRPPLRL